LERQRALLMSVVGTRLRTKNCNCNTSDKEFDMLKFIGGTMGVIFLIGLVVVIGILSLIF